MARLVSLILLLSTLAACGGGNSGSSGSVPDLRDVDLSGTWVLRQTWQNYLKETGEYLFTTTRDYPLVIRDDALGTVVNICLSHDRHTDNYVVKSEKHLLLGSPYSLNKDGTLGYQGSLEDDMYDENIQYTADYELTRISEGVNIDFGTVSATGDFTIYEDFHVCFERTVQSHLPYQQISLKSPFQDDNFYFHIRYRNDLTPGVYSYDNHNSANEVYIEVRCYATECRDTDADNITPSDVEVTFTNVSPERVTGHFSFTNEHGSQTEYTGEFDFFPPQIP